MARHSEDAKTLEKSWGWQAEQIAADFLIAEGYVIRERNWRLGNTLEIDIIAEKGKEMVFIEVKARSGDWDAPEDAVDNKKIRKIVRGADIYLRNLPYAYDYRFDIIAITGDAGNYSIEHYPDAFFPPLSSR